MLTENITLRQIIFTCFTSANQLRGFCEGGTLAINRLIVTIHNFLTWGKVSSQFSVVWRKIKTWNGGRKQRDVEVLQRFSHEWHWKQQGGKGSQNDWMETRRSDWMVANIDEASGKRSRYGDPSARAPNVKFVHFAKNEYGVRVMADTSMNWIVTNSVYLRLHLRIIHLIPLRNLQKN